MNYRHAFHAGNFADIVKHAALTRLMQLKAPRHVIDTHAGAGTYDLAGEAARKSGEARAGIERLMAAADSPPAFAPLVEAVRRLNPDGAVRIYPGSPALICGLLGKDARLTACELRPDDHGELENWFARHCSQGRALKTDGYAFAEALPGARDALVLIDPPFEQASDYDRAAEVGASLARRGAAVLVWLPLKDLETFDAFLRRLEQAGASVLIGEVRLRPLTNPMAMNGCALAIFNAPAAFEAELDQICGWAAQTLGDCGAKSKVWRLSSN